MKKTGYLLVCIISFIFACKSEAQSRFFRQYWMDYNSSINNTNPKGNSERPRVGDRGMSTDTEYWSRTEAQVNGLVMVKIADAIRNFEHAALYLELWGGHPGTANKRFQINGGRVYSVPDKPTSEENCEYLYPVISIDYTELVSGNNAIQFGCDRGSASWGHYIVDQMAVRCYLKTDNPVLKSSGLSDFSAIPKVINRILQDETIISLDYNKLAMDQIIAVHYFGRYSGYDFNGSGNDNDWHGYTHDRKFVNHIGTTTEPPYEIAWDTRMIPDQPGPMAVRALVELNNGIFYWSDNLVGLTFPANRNHILLFYTKTMPVPFWSRDNQLKKAIFELPYDIKKIESAELHIRIWDGGEGEVKEPFKLNGVPYKITTGRAVHDIVYSICRIDPETIKPGINEIELLSDTEHHGIEVCWPGPALIIRYK
jgi:hypothetical protein